MMERTKDLVTAAADLCNRAGALDFRVGWDCPHTPDVEDDHNCPGVGWFCEANYRTGRLRTDLFRNPGEAAFAMIERVIDGGTCKCGRKGSLEQRPGRCLWVIDGPDVASTCEAPEIVVTDPEVRGDIHKLEQLVKPNRAQRRAAAKRNRGRR